MAWSRYENFGPFVLRWGGYDRHRWFDFHIGRWCVVKRG